jgi:peptidoglycan-associated lipoprotein
VFYSSNGKEGLGKMDIYLAENRIEKRWEAYLLGAGINSTEDDFSFGLNKNLELGYFASSRENGKGADDLYAFDFKPKIEGVRDVYEYVPTDTLVVAMNHVLDNDKLNLEQQDPLQRLVKKEVELTAATLYGDLRLNANGSFYYKNTQPTQAKDSFAYRLKTVKGVSQDVWVNLNRSSVEKELLNPELTDAFLSIFYNLNGSSILEVYKDRVDKVVSVMNQNPTLEVELSSFTDCRGSLDYNLALSERRTNEIIGYVQERISNPNRIYGKGYGEDVSDSEFTRNFALVAGTFEGPKNVEAMVNQLRDQGYDPMLSNYESKVRVLVSQYDSRKSVDRAKSQLIADGLDVWVLINPCNLISEEEHQLKRRTDFKVIRL